MLCPVTHADPAKVMLAACAGHMIASLILFNRIVAFRTLLRVGEDPRCVFTFSTFFLDPELRCPTVAWIVHTHATSEAKLGAALTDDFPQDDQVVNALDT